MKEITKTDAKRNMNPPIAASIEGFLYAAIIETITRNARINKIELSKVPKMVFEIVVITVFALLLGNTLITFEVMKYPIIKSIAMKNSIRNCIKTWPRMIKHYTK
jgi:flagellar biosynthesis protein FliQ